MNCKHNVLVKEVKPNQEIRYSCMRCGAKFKAEEIITQDVKDSGVK
jgi:DNA-directed RNA polymerase subunit RPC12/RpoP